MYKIKKFTTSSIKYYENVEKKHIFRESTIKNVLKIRNETSEEVMNRALKWINDKNIQNFQINAIPIRIDPCNKCINYPYRKRYNEYQVHNYISTVEIYITYEKKYQKI